MLGHRLVHMIGENNVRLAGCEASLDQFLKQRAGIDSAAHRVFCGDQPVHIGPTEYRLLHFFITHAERVYTRSQLLDHVWGGGVYVEERTVDVHIRRLRKTLEPFGKDELVQTVRGAGYRFSTSV